MNFICKTFNQLSTLDLFNIYKLRSLVFVVEQNCAYQDVDEQDLEALHVMQYNDKQLIAYARIITNNNTFNIGRVVVNPNDRGKNYGNILMKYCLSKCQIISKEATISISAQEYLLKFYTNLGFCAIGTSYLEDNIPHIKMEFNL
jgi:ElaA protein